MMEPTPYSNLAPNLNGRCNEETHENCNAENIGQKATQKIDPKYEILEIYQKKQHRKTIRKAQRGNWAGTRTAERCRKKKPSNKASMPLIIQAVDNPLIIKTTDYWNRG